MSDYQHSLGAVEARVAAVETGFDRVIDLIEAQSKKLTAVNLAVELMRQGNLLSGEVQRTHTAKLEILQDTKATMKGGWLALCAIGTVLVGLSAVIGALVAWLALRHSS